MTGRWLAALVAIVLVLGTLLLFSPDNASAVTWKVGYSTTLTSNAAGANADVMSNLNIAAAHSNFSKVTTTSLPTEWGMATDAELPDGAATGSLVATATLAVVGACTTTVIVTIPLYDATTNETNTVDWGTDGSNLTLDPDGNGLPNTIDKYPSYLNTVFNGSKPRARYAGYATPIGGAPPTQLNFVVFNPGEFVGATGWQGLPRPDQQMGDALGYMNFVVQDNPTPGNAAPSTVQDFCTPLSTVTTLYGKTKGEGEAIPVAGASGETTGQCTGAAVGVNNDPLDDSVADDGCIVVTDEPGDTADSPTRINDGCPVVGATETAGAQCNEAACADADGKPPWDNCDDDADGYINDGCVAVGSREMSAACLNNTDDEPDNDADGWADEDADLVRATNPALGTGILGTNTHFFHGYGQSQRDFDGDGISNNEDGCPTAAFGGVSERELGAQCGDTLDNDADTTVDDGCPGAPRPVEKDSDADGIGDVCDPTPTGTGAQCVPAGTNADCDNDGYLNRQDNCPLVANGAAGDNQLDDDLERCGDAVDDDPIDDPGAGVMVNDGCPAVGPPESATQCAAGNAVDDDLDGKVNDGCPMVGVISESCVNGEGSTTDFGACSDAIGNSCDNVAGLNVDVANGAYAFDMAISPVCIGDTDTDGDGWCDATETLLGSTPGVGGQTSTPEHLAVDYKTTGGTTIAAGVCNDFAWYASTGDAIGNGPAVNNDGDANSNAGELDGADPGAVADCAIDASDGTDQDGVYAGATALQNKTDNCPTDWNPEQVNSDAGADATGDACDTDDDEDKISDIAEWKRGTDPKNIYSPRPFDMTGDGSVNVLDVLTFTGATATTTKPVQPATGQGKQQPWTYTFTNNTGGTIDKIRVEFWDGVKLTSITDSDAAAWTCKATGTTKLGCKRTTGTLANNGTVTLKASSNAQRELVCYQWVSVAAAKGGSWNSTDCVSVSTP